MSIKLSVPILANVVATGAAVVVGQGGFYSFAVSASAWAGATVKLQILGPDGTTFMDIDTALAFTANGIQGVELPAGATVKGVISGGPPTSVYATLSLVR